MSSTKDLKVSPIHPAVAALQSAREAAQHAFLDYSGTRRWAYDTADRLTPERWTNKIEKAMGNIDETADLRLTHREQLLTFLTVYLKECHLWNLRQEANSAVWTAMRALLAVYDSIPDSSSDRWMKSILQSVCITEDPRKVGEYTIDRFHDQHRLIESADVILGDAFDLFVAEIASVSCSAYPTGFAVTARPSGSLSFGANYDRRNMHAVPVEVRDELNLNGQLYKQIQKTSESHKAAQEAVSFLREQNGAVNEQQYAARLVAELHKPEDKRSSLEKQCSHKKAQHKHRVQYGCASNVLAAALRTFHDDYQSLTVLLTRATAEASQFVETARKEKRELHYNTIDVIQSSRVVMNNCLAADVLLRTFGRSWKEFNAVMNDDYSHGMRDDALLQEFSEVANFYRPQRTGVREEI